MMTALSVCYEKLQADAAGILETTQEWCGNDEWN